jgi:hypothetical protein
VAQAGYDALMRGDAHEVAGFGQQAAGDDDPLLDPTASSREMHRKMAEPGTGKQPLGGLAMSH